MSLLPVMLLSGACSNAADVVPCAVGSGACLLCWCRHKCVVVNESPGKRITLSEADRR